MSDAAKMAIKKFLITEEYTFQSDGYTMMICASESLLEQDKFGDQRQTAGLQTYKVDSGAQ